MIISARDIRGGSCFGEAMFPHYPAVKYVYHQYSQGATCTILRVSLENTFMLWVSPCWALFSELSVLQFSYSRESQNISSWKGSIKFIRFIKPNSCDRRVFTKSFKGCQEESSYIQVESWTPANISFLSAGLQLRAHCLSFSLVSSTTPIPNEKGITLISNLWENWAIQCLECSSWAARSQVLAVVGRGCWGRYSLYLYLINLAFGVKANSGFLHDLVWFCSAVLACELQAPG